MDMFRLTVFNDGGIILFDKNSVSVPTAVINESITKTRISSLKFSSQAQIRLGKLGEFTARLAHDVTNRVVVASLFPVQFRLDEPENVVDDIAKIYANSKSNMDRFAALVDLRLKSISVTSTEREVLNKANKSSAVDNLTADDPTNRMEPSSSNPAKKVKSKAKVSKAKNAKKMRTWDGEEDSDSDAILDYSGAKDHDATKTPDNTATASDALDLGSKSKDGFVVKELNDELSSILDSKSTEGNSRSEPFSFLKNIVGGKKITEEDLIKVLIAMEDHSVSKNVAKDVASEICDNVRRDLIGTSTHSWTSVKETVSSSMKRALSRILMPATSTDLLASIAQVHKKSIAKHDRRPYVISVVGVNGVGKSTNLGKLAFWFLQNDYKVLVAACDTFRSGAVEQLKVHVQRLNQSKGSNGAIELFDQGYGKDAAVIAKHAVDYGTKNDFDVVLIDTAGRRHNDDRLMSSLEKFGNLAQPDKIIMVGEALVGTDSVDQARNFDAAFGKSRHLDFFLISKCDTVGEMLGTLVNVTHATGVPVSFVGVGQQYTDLRTLSVEWAVEKLSS